MDRRDLQLCLVQSLFAAPGSTEGWERFLLELCDALHGSAAKFIAHNLGPGSAITANVSVSAHTDPRAVDEYQRYWCRHDPWRNGMSPDVTPGTVLVGDTLISPSQISRTGFYNDFARRYGTTQCIAGILELSPHAVSNISVNRTDRGRRFDSDDADLLQALMPHLQRALQLHRRLVGAEGIAQRSMEALDRLNHAMLLLDRRGRVTFANGRARQILRDQDGLTLNHGELRAANPADTGTLRQAVASAVATSLGTATSSGGILSLGRPSGRRRLRLVIAPVAMHQGFFGADSAGAIVSVADPERVAVPDEGTLRSLFGLTPAEAVLTRLVAQGVTLEEAAARLGLRLETLRTRLKTIFEKTDTHRQVDLVRLVLLTASQL
jgi:DNA-binding CsgD family transcriptional regulator/PAS domain-containing protein